MSEVVDLGALGAGGFSIQGDGTGDQAGFSISAAGDFNGDGFDDIIVGAPFNDSGGPDSGAAYLIYGRAGGFHGIDLSSLQPADGFLIQGDRALDNSGLSIAGAGDVNGDGFDDLIIQANRKGLLGYGIGVKAYVVFGTGNPPSSIDLTTLAPPAGFLINGPFDVQGGGTVAAAGDINGDGFADIIIGVPRATNGGAAYVIFGKQNGFGTVDVGNLGTGGFVINANTDLFNVGQRVSSAGDVNGDGFDDLIVTAARSGFYHYGSTTSAYVIFGKQNGFGTVNLSALPAANGFEIVGQYSYGNTGLSLSRAGDVNGDGFDDLILGAREDSAAYVIFGKAGGFSALNVGNLPASAGFAIHGLTGNLTGYSVSSAGDVNGDGFNDLIIGAPNDDGGGTDAGAAYVIFGKAGGFTNINLANVGPADGFVIRGDSDNDNAGWSVSAAGDMNHDGFGDLLVGAPGSELGGHDAGEAYVIFGRSDLGRPTPNDFNGDRRSDVLLVNSNGTVTDWLGQPNGTFVSNHAAATYLLPANWHFWNSGDFNGDGRVDLLLRNDNGIVTQWLGQASGGFSWNSAATYALATSWQIAGAGDFNGDGRADILLVNDNGALTDWLGQANGTFFSNHVAATYVLPSGWNVAGTGDFNGDGRDDLLIRKADGAIIEWLGQSNGTFFSNQANATYGLDPSWHLADTGDFNGDGRADVLLRNDNGTITEWLGQGNGGFSWNSVATYGLATSWHVAETGDFNGDGRDDVLLRHDNGTITEWLGQANGTFGWNSSASYLLDNSWQVQPNPSGLGAWDY